MRICPACENPAKGNCLERVDGIHPTLKDYAEEMLDVLDESEFREWMDNLLEDVPDWLKKLPGKAYVHYY